MNFPSADAFQGESKTDTWRGTFLLAFQSLGIVFGHLSIGPLYVLHTAADSEVKSKDMLYGLMSFIFWTMTLIPLVKYIFIIMRADDNGEGGIFALYSLFCRHGKVGLLPSNQIEDELFFDKEDAESTDKNSTEKNKKRRYLMWFMAMLGSCSVIASGVLVPTISVLSASSSFARSLGEILFQSPGKRDKLQVDSDIPIAYTILLGLFVLQHYGTHKIGFLFAPIIIAWLLFISGLGVYNIVHWDPHIVSALSPYYMFNFLRNLDMANWRSLGGVILCTAGSEAMFADLGHFSKRSIKIAFSFLVYPALILCYLGQTAFISENWKTDGTKNVTYLHSSVPAGNIRHVYACISLLASAVGSQGAITATFSIIKQCLALDCFPRVKVVHTSSEIHGQIYIPDVNWILMVSCFVCTFAFKNISRVGYAIALSQIIGMLITTCFMSLIIALHWNKALLGACFLTFFGVIEAVYFLACVLDIEYGAWIFIVLVEILLIVMLSWHYGVAKKYQFDMENKVSIDWLTSFGPSLGISRVPGIGFVCTDITKGIPAFFSHFVTNLPAFHQVLVFVSFKSMPIPQVPSNMQLLIGRMGPKNYRIYRCVVRYGYRDNINGDVNDFEDQIIHGIGEFISQDDDNICCNTSEDRVVVSGNLHGGNALITTTIDADENGNCNDVELQKQPSRKKVHFQLPPESPRMKTEVREELQELVDAREHGTTYIVGKSDFVARNGSNLLRRFMIGVYVFLVRNCRAPTTLINIPNAAHVEVGVSYTV